MSLAQGVALLIWKGIKVALGGGPWRAQGSGRQDEAGLLFLQRPGRQRALSETLSPVVKGSFENWGLAKCTGESPVPDCI